MGARNIKWLQEADYKAKPSPWTTVGGVESRQFLEFELDPQQNVETYQESVYREPSPQAIFGGFVGKATAKLLGRPDAVTNLFKWAFGAVAFDASDTPTNLHTFTVGETLKSFHMELDTGLTADGEYLAGCLIESLQWSGSDGKEMLIDVEIQYADSLQAANIVAASYPSVRPFKLTDCVLIYGGGTLKASSVTTKIENTIPDDRHTTGSREFATIDVEDAKISGEMDVKFESWDEMDDYYGGAGAPADEVLPIAMTQIWTGGISSAAVPYKLAVTLPKIVPIGNPITITGRETLMQRISWEALYNDGNKVELWNQHATVVD